MKDTQAKGSLRVTWSSISSQLGGTGRFNLGVGVGEGTEQMQWSCLLSIPSQFPGLPKVLAYPVSRLPTSSTILQISQIGLAMEVSG